MKNSTTKTTNPKKDDHIDPAKASNAAKENAAAPVSDIVRKLYEYKSFITRNWRSETDTAELFMAIF